MTTLKLNVQSNYPLEAASISPDQFLGKTELEIAHLPAVLGNVPCELGEFFTISTNGAEEIVLEGDLSRVKHIGAGMTQGKITIVGNVGMHLGAQMQGGEITVFGNAGDWAGAEMAGGKIHIHGNAGHALGAAYRGGPRGMSKGVILVDGDVGNEAGAMVRRGLIAVGGSTGDFPGAFMIAGTLVAFGSLGGRPGAGMKRGTLVAFQPPELLPTYRYDCTYQPAFLRLILQNLRSQGMPVTDEMMAASYRRYSGDFNALGKGEILVYDQH